MGLIRRFVMPMRWVVVLLIAVTPAFLVSGPTTAHGEEDYGDDQAIPISSTSIQVGETVTLYNNYDWDYDIDFGDGTTGALLPTDPNGATVSSLEHTYSSPGTYEIKGTRVDGTLMWMNLYTVTVSGGDESTTTTEETTTTTEETTTTTEEPTTTTEETTTTVEETTTTLGESTATTIGRVQPVGSGELAATAVEVAQETAAAGGLGITGMAISGTNVLQPLRIVILAIAGGVLVPVIFGFLMMGAATTISFGTVIMIGAAAGAAAGIIFS